MDTTEKLGYLKGLLDGLDLDQNKKEAKVFNAIVDVLDNLVEDVDDMQDGIEMLVEQVDAVDEDLAELEDYVFDDECDCDDCSDDECNEFQVECPLCGEEITVDEETVLGGPIPCPNCGEMLEFEIEECDCDDCAQEDEDE
ncbi:MAG: hypothetical protein LIO62_02370 [Clostridiales bacterium]|nr:hypothetical protein [Clostridiales bacterium]